MAVVTSAFSTSEIAPGAVLAGKYRVERVIGQGGMGVVIEARHTTLDDRVALKFLLPEYATHPEASQRFLREARAAVKIKSPHIARVSDVGTLESGLPYMVMEFLDGVDAAHLVAGGQRLPVPDAIDFVVQAGDAIAEAHGLGIVHRDIKPANLFVTRHSDGTPFVKILDFGISKMMDETGVDGLTRTSTTMGSALYMSPEQIKQSKSVDHRTDIYALGVTTYELLTGRQPFMAESFAALCVEIATGTPTPLRELRPDLPAELAAVIERAYARDREQRFQSVAELLMALAPWAPARSQPIIERVARAGGLVRSFGSEPRVAARGSHAELTAPPAPAATGMTGAATVAPVTRPSRAPYVVLGAGILVLGLGGAALALVKLRTVDSAASPLESAQPAALSSLEPPPASAPEAEVLASTPPPPPAPSASAPAPAPVSPPKPLAVPKIAASKLAAKKLEPKAPEPAPVAPAPTKPKSDATSYR